MRIIFKKTFQKQLKKWWVALKNIFLKKLEIFVNNEFDKRLHNHSLQGKLMKYRSINITGDVRALYYKENNGTIVVFAIIGSHSQLY